MNYLIITQSTQQFHRENYHTFVTFISFFLTTCFGQRCPSSGLQVPNVYQITVTTIFIILVIISDSDLVDLGT
jgi:hypothetical protein